MKHSTSNILDVIVVGAGHAGLSTSYFLTRSKLTHIVFERGRIGETWRSQRWDSFSLNTPNHMNVLPGEADQNFNPGGFLLRQEVIDKLTNYANTFKIPVREKTTVTSVTKTLGENYFLVNVQHEQSSEQWLSKQVVIASGAMSAPEIPSMSEFLSRNIFQIHVAEYRSVSKLPPGAVMIVGGGQSGCQVAEDIVAGGRTVFLASSRVGRMPRRYRGKDIFDWLTKMDYFDVLKDNVTDPGELTTTTPLISGVGKLGHTVSLQSLHKQGVIILGRLIDIENDTMHFATDAAENIDCGDEFSKKIKTRIDNYIAGSGAPAHQGEQDEADRPDISISCAQPISSVDCSKEKINSVIWTTGFTGDFSWIKLPVLRSDGKPIHLNGISPVSGLYFIGFPWLRSRKSGIIYGITDDAAYIVKEIEKNRRKPDDL